MLLTILTTFAVPTPPVADHLTGPVQPLTQVDEEEDEFLPDFLR